MVEYQARFLTLERFMPGSFASEKKWAAQFVSRLKISISVMATFSCMTLGEVDMRALEWELAH